MFPGVKSRLSLWLRLAALGTLDVIDVLTLRRRAMTPSRLANHHIGGFNFHEVGHELASIVRTLGSLQPHERVLDVGCGYGRVAVALTQYLTTGEYAGFDIDRRAILWCQREISRSHPRFWFNHVDVANSYYNPGGVHVPESFTFPCADSSVDVAVATSVFTHLLPASAARYIAEIARVLKPGGRAVVTFFLFDDDDSKHRLGVPPMNPAFRHFPEPFFGVSDPMNPEMAVAYDVAAVRQVFRDVGLLVHAIERGSWAVNPDPLTFQDVVIAGKPH